MKAGVVLWALAAVLGAVVAVEWLWPQRAPVVATRPPAIPAAAPGVAPREPLDAWAQAVLERPLFSPGRRPDAVAAAAASEAEHVPLPRLAGIMLTREGRRAIFAAAGPGGATVAGEGAQIGDWRVQVIRAGEVVLAGPAGERLVRPSYSDRPAAEAAVPPPVPGLLGPSPVAEAGPFSSLAQPSGASIFRNAPVPLGVGTPR